VCAVLLGSAVVLALGPQQNFWQMFDHVAATLAVAGLILALPALSFAMSTERRTIEIERQVVDISGVRDQAPALRGTEIESRGESSEPTVDLSGDDAVASHAPQPDEEQTLQAAIEELESRPSIIALDGAVRAGAPVEGVAKLLREADVWGLGDPAGDTSVPGRGTESDVLHFEVEEDGKTSTMMPLFTQADVLRDALLRNPEWQTVSVLEMNGGDLLDNRDGDVTLVLNPWSPQEYQIPPCEQHSSSADTPEQDTPDQRPRASHESTAAVGSA
jgi:hypothetical protein